MHGGGSVSSEESSLLIGELWWWMIMQCSPDFLVIVHSAMYGAPTVTGLGNHMNAMHKDIQHAARSRYVQMLEGEYLRNQHCRYCGFTSKANTPKAQNRKHRCAVVVQLAALLVVHDGRFGECRGSSGRSRDEDFSGASAKRSESREGRLHRGRSCEASSSTIRRRVIRKSRPTSAELGKEITAHTQAQQQQEEEQSNSSRVFRRPAALGDAAVQVMYQTGGHAKLAQTGYGDDPAYVNRSRWTRSAIVSHLGEMEGTEASAAHLHFLSAPLDIVSCIAGGADLAAQQTGDTSSYTRHVAAGSQERTGQPRSSILVSHVESREAGACPTRDKALDIVRCPVPCEGYPLSSHSWGDPPISRLATSQCQDAVADSCFHARSWNAIESSDARPSTSVRLGAELVSSADRCAVATCDTSEVKAVSGDPAAAGPDECVIVDLQASSTATSLIRTAVTTAGVPTTMQVEFLSHIYINTGVVCYMNSVMTVLGWCWCSLTNFRRLGRLHELLNHLLAEKVRILMLESRIWERNDALAFSTHSA